MMLQQSQVTRPSKSLDGIDVQLIMLQWTGTSSWKGFDVTNILLTQSWMSNQADEEMALLFFQFVSNLKECHL